MEVKTAQPQEDSRPARVDPAWRATRADPVAALRHT